jgi:hypothetical protein
MDGAYVFGLLSVLLLLLFVTDAAAVMLGRNCQYGIVGCQLWCAAEIAVICCVRKWLGM